MAAAKRKARDRQLARIDERPARVQLLSTSRDCREANRDQQHSWRCPATTCLSVRHPHLAASVEASPCHA